MNISQYEISRHGLSEVYSPQANIDVVAHIIFVHGLFGHPETTWTGRPPRSRSPLPTTEQRSESPDTINGVFWPAALLPKTIPNVKVSTWGYDADIDGFWPSPSQNTVTQHAAGLLADLADLIESDGDLPIFFVVHSLGGIVVKAAMNQSAATRGTRLSAVLPTIHGIVFLGTPHRGSSSAALGKIAYGITTTLTRRPNLKLLSALEKNSETLDQIGRTFVQTLEGSPHLQVYSFREEKETRRYWIFNTMVVEADSATIGLAKEETSSIPESHSGMTKYYSEKDIGFKRVSAQVRRWVRALSPNLPNLVDETYNDCVLSLKSATIKLRLESVSESHAKTFHWLFDSKIVSFSEWLQGSRNNTDSIYWIQGKPGSGKSTLMKFAMKHPNTLQLLTKSEDTPYLIAGFFFHDRGAEIQKSIPGMLQGILYSILIQTITLRQFVQPIYAELCAAQKTKIPHWSLESLRKAFEAIVQQRQIVTRLCLFLDALDEHHGDNDHLVGLMRQLVSDADGKFVKIKLCLASRPWDTFVAHFENCPGFKIHLFMFQDIKNYTSSKLHDSAPKDINTGSIDPSRQTHLDRLALSISEKAQGVFVWVRIVVQEITRGVGDRTPYFVLEKALDGMPEELEDLYEHTLSRIESHHADEAFVMLQIALCAFAPLQLDTFVNTTSHALWGEVPDVNEATLEDMTQRVISRSGGLLEVVQILPPNPDKANLYYVTQQAVTQRRLGVVQRAPVSRQWGVALCIIHAIRVFQKLRTKQTRQYPIVQFLHQTVKEFAQKRKDNFGLKLTISGGTGYEYLMATGAKYIDPWAQSVCVDVFEYARFTRLASMENPGGIDHLILALYEISGSNVAFHGPSSVKIDWWLMQQRGFVGTFYSRSVSIRSPSDQLELVALAAGLFAYVGARIQKPPWSRQLALMFHTAVMEPIPWKR
ncbi:hypothetical protein F5884DRAFT_853390 [Xylogone sp. PMI_703]|nr:hypothetical protein F5884DRAFT_853390 [Xylogone sp. PMI_703]